MWASLRAREGRRRASNLSYETLKSSPVLACYAAFAMATDLKRLGFVPKYSAAGLEAVTGSKTCVGLRSSLERRSVSGLPRRAG